MSFGSVTGAGPWLSLMATEVFGFTTVPAAGAIEITEPDGNGVAVDLVGGGRVQVGYAERGDGIGERELGTVGTV